MEDNEMVTIQNSDGTKVRVELVTYLIDDNNFNTYLVYSKGEKIGDNSDEIIYISKVVSDDDLLKISEIVDDSEWLNVQNLLKKIANTQNGVVIVNEYRLYF